ncbi:siderophore-interacting protein [Actinoplanes couchii]|uniref:siderophore-interacting protein n=1 Tax=Actinoplanes couchii TaxID=403638 RepID=UPI001942A59E|nr:siderophore-interacting protein [Actinoplanes couchii]MDR6321496.1 NADPH-dependent ferric siderophore reductase [Actinoplanes couchii]
MTQTAVPTQAVPFRFFPVQVARTEQLSPNFLRVTFTGDELIHFADNGWDQRIKLIPPLADSGFEHLPTGEDWYLRWRELPDEKRNPIRTYTIRDVRAADREIDVDMVLHGVNGPASRWAVDAVPGSLMTVLGPNAEFDGPSGGIDFHPPAGTRRILLVGDETAVPAIASILARLPQDAVGHALLEVPESADELAIVAPPNFTVTWLPRDGEAHGVKVIPAVREVATKLLGDCVAPVSAPVLEDVDIDEGILWEVPEESAGAPDGFYAWLAGEAGVIKTLRRHLVSECGVDRRAVAFMGYWRLGRAES